MGEVLTDAEVTKKMARVSRMLLSALHVATAMENPYIATQLEIAALSELLQYTSLLAEAGGLPADGMANIRKASIRNGTRLFEIAVSEGRLAERWER